MMTGEDAEKLWDLIRSCHVGMLVTRGGDFLHARPMGLIQDDMLDGALWFFTEKSSAKQAELLRDPQVCVTFADRHEHVYVSITGNAVLEESREKIHKFWNRYAGAYFVNGKDDPDLALLRIEVQKAEYWDSDNNRRVQLFELLKARITHHRPDMGEHSKISG